MIVDVIKRLVIYKLYPKKISLHRRKTQDTGIMFPFQCIDFFLRGISYYAKRCLLPDMSA